MKETYVWVLVLAAIVAVALYFRLFYQPPMGIALAFNASTPHLIYPYQRVSLPLLVENTGGSAIMNMSIGIEINGNLSSLYKVTLPSGKQTVILFNYTPVAPGVYLFKAVADPGMLYNIANRAGTTSSAAVTVNASQSATPYELFPRQDLVTLRTIDLNRTGYVVDAYLHSIYNLSNFSLTDNVALNSLLAPLLAVSASYITNVSVAQARYANGSEAYAVWLMGYITPEAASTAEAARSVHARSVVTASGDVTFAALSNTTTICSWYSLGWTKILAASNGASCAALLNLSSAKVSTPPLTPYLDRIHANGTLLGEYRGNLNPTNYAAKLYYSGNASFVYASVANGTQRSATDNICYGIISDANGTSYCSSYLFPVSASANGTSMFRTVAYVGPYNLSVLSLVNTSRILAQVPINIGVIRGFSITGTSAQFVSGIRNSCALSLGLFCSNITFSNSSVTFRLTNTMNYSVRLTSIACYQYPPSSNFTLNRTLGEGAVANITAPCWSLGSRISGIPVSLHLNLALNYFAQGRNQTINGVAFIPFG